MRGKRAFDGSCELERELFEKQAAICKSFANPRRLQLLDLLAKGERAVSDLQSELKISKANLSQHLAILKASGVVVVRREGKHVLCSLAMPEVKQACQIIRDVLRAHVRESRKLVMS